MTDPNIPVSPNTGEVKRTISTTESTKYTSVHRNVETFFFIVGCLIASSGAVIEVLHRARVRLGSGDPDHSFPWFVVIMCTLLVAPKVFGRVAAGRAYGKLADKFGGGGD